MRKLHEVLSRVSNTGIPHFTALALLCFTGVALFYELNTRPSSSKNMMTCITMKPTSLYHLCHHGGLEPNPQNLQSMPEYSKDSIN